MAARQGRVASPLDTHGNSSLDPLNPVVTTIVAAVGVPSTDLPSRSNAATELATGSAGRDGLGDHNAAVSILYCALGDNGGLSGPGAAVVDAERRAETVLDELDVDAGTAADSVGDAVARRDADIHVADGADDRGHLHVPVDKGLGLVGDNVVGVVARGALLVAALGGFSILKIRDIGSVVGDPRGIKLGSTDLDAGSLKRGQVDILLDDVLFRAVST
jgi:hypothetical protein